MFFVCVLCVLGGRWRWCFVFFFCLCVLGALVLVSALAFISLLPKKALTHIKCPI